MLSVKQIIVVEIPLIQVNAKAASCCVRIQRRPNGDINAPVVISGRKIAVELCRRLRSCAYPYVY